MSKRRPGKLIKKNADYPNTWRITAPDLRQDISIENGSWSVGIAAAAPGTHDVTFEFQRGKAFHVRLAGEPEAAAAPPASERPRTPPAGDQRRDADASRPRPQAVQRARVDGHFHNPYNFVPAPPPKDLAGLLGHRAPRGHDRYHEDCWSGRIDIRIETVTPLLLPDAARAKTDANGHKTFPLRVDTEGKPYLAPTSLKGALRSAYEAVTNSRLGVFGDHDVPLARRMEAREALNLVPARIEERNGKLSVVLLTGTCSKLGPGGQKANDDPMLAAWLPFYRGRRYEGPRPRHGDAVVAQLDRATHERRGFPYWSVRAIRKIAAEGELAEVRKGLPRTSPTDRTIEVVGFSCITNRNIGNKHDERLFFSHPAVRAPAFDLTDGLAKDWTSLIKDYRAANERVLTSRPRREYDQFLRNEIGGYALSRHLYEEGSETLKPGDLCYARLEAGQPTALFPVMIGRELAARAPARLLHPDLKPAQSRDKLSPADRVFGWVRQDGNGSWRGQLRIGPVHCEKCETASTPGGSLPLAILSTPKPQQARFYLASDDAGSPVPEEKAKGDIFYQKEMSLRGRKTYPHHLRRGAAADQHLADPFWSWEQALNSSRTWTPETARDYVRPQPPQGDQRDDQNRSIEGWVKPGSVFTTSIDVTNLNAAELGALLWLLHLPEGHFHRLGGGKPLGFGSARITVTNAELRKGSEIARTYESLVPSTDQADAAAWREVVKGLVEKFQHAVVDAYGQRGPGQARQAVAADFGRISFIAAFLRSAGGFSDAKPVHYPRKSRAPDREGKSYSWFVVNEQSGRDAPPRNKSH